MYEVSFVNDSQRPYRLYCLLGYGSFCLTILNRVYIMYDSLPDKVKFIYELTGKIEHV